MIQISTESRDAIDSSDEWTDIVLKDIVDVTEMLVWRVAYPSAHKDKKKLPVLMYVCGHNRRWEELC